MRISLFDGKEIAMETLGIASVASITVICYLLGMLFKALGWDKWIPTLMGIWGCVFGINQMYKQAGKAEGGD